MDHHSHNAEQDQACCPPKQQTDYILNISLFIIVTAYLSFLLFPRVEFVNPLLFSFNESVFLLMNKMWWSVLLGIVFVGILAGVPRELVMSILGQGGTFNGLLRATAGGVLLDLCSHGILLVGMQLYRRGASLGQVMAFLIASPWNSLSLTFILWALVGFKWTLTIVFLSLVIAILSGLLFEQLVARGVLPKNPHSVGAQNHNGLKREFHTYWQSIQWTPAACMSMLKTGLVESRMILRWIFFGVVLAAGIQATVSTEMFTAVFGPTLLGLGATLVFATILEVCSEGSMPVAADFLLRAKAPGNMFAFLMTGVATDYTEILSLKETTGRWKVAFFLPLVTLPQVVVIALVLNQWT